MAKVAALEELKEQGGKRVVEGKLAELQKAETWDDVYKDLKVRVTMESVGGVKTKVSEAACVVMAKAIKDMLKKEFGERWGHHVSSTRRFIVY